MNRLSKRLEHIAAAVQQADVLADVGCDHGYLPIYLLGQGRIKRAIAMDIGKGPLMRASAHIREEGLEQSIQTRLSDGLQELSKGEVDAVVIAGMGGSLIIDILSRGMDVVSALSQLVLEPQSQLSAVRRFLREQKLYLADEDLVLEDGKFYPILSVEPAQAYAKEPIGLDIGPDIEIDIQIDIQLEILDAYGPHLLKKRHPVLMQYLKKEHETCVQILRTLEMAAFDDERILMRRAQLMKQLSRNEAAAAYMKAGEID